MWPILFVALLAQAPDYVAEGLKALDAGNSDAAVELFTKAVAAEPADYSAHFNLALAYSTSNKDAQAIPEYRKTLDLHPGLYEALLNLSISLLNVNDPAAAIPLLKEAAEQKPREFRPVYYLGDALLATKQFAEAQAAYQKAVEMDAASAGAELGLGQALAQQGQRNEAEPHYRKAANLEHEYHNFLLELATQYEDHHELPQALDIYREFPDNPGAQERAGVLLLQTGQSAAAITTLEPVVAKSPTPANQIALAQAYVKEKQLAKAEPLAAKGVAAAPEDFDLRMFHARILRDERRFPSAAEEFSTAAKIKPDATEAWTELAGVLIMAEQPLDGLAALDHVRDLGAETSGHFYLRAITLDRLQRSKEALEAYTKFLAASQNVNPDQEFIARQRVKALEKVLGKR
ncbi:MAG: tetratricopeptide repeat protein [Acidobacteriia bacterium]|nr:tetratricopeptide repeat protein [Terriglobia bacterium]